MNNSHWKYKSVNERSNSKRKKQYVTTIYIKKN